VLEPGEQRLLVDDADGRWWWLRLDGTGRCGLGGELALHAHRNRARLDQLTVEGQPWSSSGPGRARDSLRAWLLEEARRPRSTLSDEDRAWLELQLASP
jgi:hypothetical protein